MRCVEIAGGGSRSARVNCWGNESGRLRIGVFSRVRKQKNCEKRLFRCVMNLTFVDPCVIVQGVPLANEPGISLTLRLLMSYIYIYIYIYIYMERLFLMFLDYTQRRTTVGRTPLDE